MISKYLNHKYVLSSILLDWNNFWNVPAMTGSDPLSDIELELGILCRLEHNWEFLWGMDSIWSWFGNSLMTPNVEALCRGAGTGTETTFFFPDWSACTT